MYWCAARYEVNERRKKDTKSHSMQRMKYNLITPEVLAALAQSQCSPPIAVNKLPLYTVSRSLPSFLGLFWFSIVPLRAAAVVYERNNRFLRSNIRFD